MDFSEFCTPMPNLKFSSFKIHPMAELWGDIVSNRFGSFMLASDVLFDLKLEDAERCFCQMVESKIPAMLHKDTYAACQAGPQEEFYCQVNSKDGTIWLTGT